MGNYISLRIAGSDISSTTLVSTVALVSPSCGVVESESFIDSAATAGAPPEDIASRATGHDGQRQTSSIAAIQRVDKCRKTVNASKTRGRGVQYGMGKPGKSHLPPPSFSKRVSRNQGCGEKRAVFFALVYKHHLKYATAPFPPSPCSTRISSPCIEPAPKYPRVPNPHAPYCIRVPDPIVVVMVVVVGNGR